MKNIIYIIICIALIGCKSPDNVTDTIKWIDTADKPIVVKLHTINGWTMENRYTLIDAKSNIYNTGAIELTLPDTIK